MVRRTNDFHPMKTDKRFAKDMEEIMSNRMRNGLDKRSASFRELTREVSRDPLFERIKSNLSRLAREPGDRKSAMNKRGGVGDVLVMMLVGFFAVIMFAVIIFMVQQFTDVLRPLGVIGGHNTTADVDQVFGALGTGVGVLRILAFMIIVSLGFAILIGNFFVRGNAVFFGIYLLFMIVAVPVAVFISNVYETLLATNFLGTALNSFTASNFLLLNLPIFVTVIGIFGAITLYAGMQAEKGEGTI